MLYVTDTLPLEVFTLLSYFTAYVGTWGADVSGLPISLSCWAA
jgi:hypothetical protein